MKAIQLVGYKKSGKTSLAAALADNFEQNGLRVSVLKFSHHDFELGTGDTAKLSSPGRITAGISNRQSIIHWGEKRWFLDMLPLLNADMLIVEGGKSLGIAPRVICLDNMENMEALNPRLAIASFGSKPSPSLPGLPHFYPEDLKDPHKISGMAKIITEQSFLLPGLNCSSCGRENCEDLAAAILRKQANDADCKALGDEIQILSNGLRIALNSFTAKIVAGSINGMLRELKGFAPGDIEIKIKSAGN